MSDDRSTLSDTTAATIARAQDGVTAHYRVLDPLRDTLGHDATRDLGKRTYEALKAFESLQGKTVTVGLLYPETKDSINGRAHSHNLMFCVPGDEYTSNVTIYHELGHIAIYLRNENGEDHPHTSEEYCSIFSMAKMPPNAVDEQRVPYLGPTERPTEELPEICRRALDYRENHRNYIQQCKEWL